MGFFKFSLQAKPQKKHRSYEHLSMLIAKVLCKSTKAPNSSGEARILNRILLLNTNTRTTTAKHTTLLNSQQFAALPSERPSM